MSTSGAEKPTKRAKRIIKELESIKNTYVSYSIGHNHKEWKHVVSIFKEVEDYIVELSSERRALEAELAEKIKSVFKKK